MRVMFVAALWFVSSSVFSQTTHILNITSTAPLQIPGIRWGMSKEESRKVFRDYNRSNIYGDSDESFGLPYYKLYDTEFFVDAGFDKLAYQYDDEMNRTGATKLRIAKGLNDLTFTKWNGCYENDYYKLRKIMLDKLEVASPETISGETQLKNRSFTFLLPNGVGTVTLQSRCDNPNEKYRWLVINFYPGKTKEPANCRRIPNGTRWVADGQGFYEFADAHGTDREWARINARKKLPYSGNYCREKYASEISAGQIRSVEQIGGKNEHCRKPSGNDWSGYDVTCFVKGECKFVRAEETTELQCE